jgi:hypothetical protein
MTHMSGDRVASVKSKKKKEWKGQIKRWVYISRLLTLWWVYDKSQINFFNKGVGLDKGIDTTDIKAEVLIFEYWCCIETENLNFRANQEKRTGDLELHYLPFYTERKSTPTQARLWILFYSISISFSINQGSISRRLIELQNIRLTF